MSGNSKNESGTVRYVRTVRIDNYQDVQQYVRKDLRADLKRAGTQWPILLLQLWSSLHPDPAAAPTRPIADVRRYVQHLIGLALAGRFRAPPRIASVRRDQARAARRTKATGIRQGQQKAPATARTVDGAAELNKLMATLSASAGTVRRIGG